MWIKLNSLFYIKVTIILYIYIYIFFLIFKNPKHLETDNNRDK